MLLPRLLVHLLRGARPGVFRVVKPSLSATTTITQTTSVKLAAHIRQMLKARCEEHAKIATEIKERKSRQERICTEVEDLFAKADQLDALDNGTEIDGHKVKKVRGDTSTLDKMALMQAVGLTPSDLDAFYDTKPKKAYIKISKAGERDEE